MADGVFRPCEVSRSCSHRISSLSCGTWPAGWRVPAVQAGITCPPNCDQVQSASRHSTGAVAGRSECESRRTLPRQLCRYSKNGGFRLWKWLANRLVSQSMPVNTRNYELHRNNHVKPVFSCRSALIAACMTFLRLVTFRSGMNRIHPKYRPLALKSFWQSDINTGRMATALTR